MLDYLYRFRSNITLFEFEELEKQEIYFSSIEELNDPMEGFKNVFWKGNEIVWRTLLEHYLIILEFAYSESVVCGNDELLNMKNFRNFAFKVSDEFETSKRIKLAAEIRKVFLMISISHNIQSYLLNKEKCILES